MSAERLTIQVTTYTWSNCEPYQVNYFSGLNPTQSRDSIDLRGYIQNAVRVRMDAEGIKGEQSPEELLPKGETCSLEMFDYDGQLYTFFKLRPDTTFIKWRVKILYDSVVKHDLWLHPRDIEYETSLDGGLVLYATLGGFYREFKQYFESVPLPNADTFPWFQHGTVPNFTVMTFSDFLSDLLNIQVSISTPNWYIAGGGAVQAQAGYQSAGGMAGGKLYVADDDSYYLWRNSYERTVSTGDTIFNFIRGCLGSMGWLFFFDIVNGENVLRIVPRSQAGSNVINIAYNETLAEGFREGKETYDTYDHILILNGRMIGGDGAFSPIFLPDTTGALVKELKGENFVLLSDTLPNYRSEFFNRIKRTPLPLSVNLTGNGTVIASGVVNGTGLGEITITGVMNFSLPIPIPTTGNIEGTITGDAVLTGTNPETYTNKTFNFKTGGAISLVKNGNGGFTLSTSGSMVVTGVANIQGTGTTQVTLASIPVGGNINYSYQFYFTTIEDYYWYKYGGEDDNKYILQRFTNQLPFTGILELGTIWHLPKDKTLVIDSGHNAVQQTKIVVGSSELGLFKSQEFGGEVDPNHSDMIISGNYGSMLFKDDGTITDYTRYTESKEFKDNFSRWLSTETRQMEYNYDGLVSSLDSSIHFSERGELPFENDWYLLGFEVDYTNEITQLKLTQ